MKKAYLVFMLLLVILSSRVAYAKHYPLISNTSILSNSTVYSTSYSGYKCQYHISDRTISDFRSEKDRNISALIVTDVNQATECYECFLETRLDEEFVYSVENLFRFLYPSSHIKGKEAQGIQISIWRSVIDNVYLDALGKDNFNNTQGSTAHILRGPGLLNSSLRRIMIEAQANEYVDAEEALYSSQHGWQYLKDLEQAYKNISNVSDSTPSMGNVHRSFKVIDSDNIRYRSGYNYMVRSHYNNRTLFMFNGIYSEQYYKNFNLKIRWNPETGTYQSYGAYNLYGDQTLFDAASIDRVEKMFKSIYPDLPNDQKYIQVLQQAVWKAVIDSIVQDEEDMDGLESDKLLDSIIDNVLRDANAGSGGEQQEVSMRPVRLSGLRMRSFLFWDWDVFPDTFTDIADAAEVAGVAATPIPGPALLLMSGLVGVIFLRRKFYAK